jgi:DNA polymerase IV
MIRLGVSPRTSAGFVGTKIAFSRVPDLTGFKNYDDLFTE